MFKKIAAAVALVAASSAAFAVEPTPFYAGVDVSSTKISGSDDEGGYGAFIGYKINPNVAVEGGYHRLVDADQRIAGFDTNVKLDQMDISLVGSLPLSGGFDMYGRIGFNRLESESKVGGFTAEDHTSNAMYGIGLGYAFAPAIKGRLEVQKPDSDVTKIVAGVAFAF